MISMDIETAQFFKESIETIKEIKEEGIFVFDDEGLHIKGLDRSHIQYVEALYPVSFFKEYSISAPIKIGVDFSDLLVFLKRWKKTSITINWEDTPMPGIIKFCYPETKREFKLKTLDIEENDIQPPALEYPNRIIINKKDFKEALQDFNKFCDKLWYQVGDELNIKGENESGEMNIKIGIEETIEKIPEWEDSKCCITSDLIDKVIKKIPEKQLIIEHGNDMALDIISKHQDAYLKILTAPRIEVEE